MQKSDGEQPEDRPPFLKFLPEIDGASCLLALSAASRCDACAKACPASALMTGDNGLNFDEEACTGCGLCVPACPEGAIASPFRPRLFDRAGNRAVFIACRSALPGTDQQDGVPCLDALGLRDLASIWRKGADEIVVMSCPSDSCPSGGGQFRQRAALTARVFASRSEDFPKITTASPSEWTGMRMKAKPCSPGRVLDRRGLFGLFTPKAAEKPEDRRSAAFDFPVGRGRDALAVFVPRIDPELCSGCDACVRTCPHAALAQQVRADGGGAEYVIDPAACTGCGLCVDICEDSAIALTGPGSASREHVPLYGAHCSVCGVPFHSPKQQSDSGHSCRICAKIGSAKKLFFVHDQN